MKPTMGLKFIKKNKILANNTEKKFYKKNKTKK